MFIQYPDIIILAGGLGTRLKSEVPDVPKPMAPIGGRPFLEYIFNHINNAGFQRVVLSVGHLSEMISSHFKNQYKSIEISYSIEKEPLGTGGAIKLASSMVSSPHFIVLNGDTFFPIDLQRLFQTHVENLANVTIALRQVENANRYGIIEFKEGNIVSFKEKSDQNKPGLINGGIYIISKRYFDNLNLPEKFSFERDFLQTHFQIHSFKGQIFDDYFLDIGIPDDYKRAQKELDEFENR